MEHYDILEAIGEGSFGRVFRGRERTSRRIVALKFLPKRNKIERELQSLRRECEIQTGLFHPNIVQMIDSFETSKEVVAVSEYVPNQLYGLLEKHGPLKEYKVQKIACDLVSAIYYLHSHRILHRDIKPQNILLTNKPNEKAKLCDFGFSRRMGINTYVLTSIKGTPLYMAPELIDENPYDHRADLWALGCILFELLTGKPPYCTTSIVQLVKMIRNDPISWPTNFSAECLEFLRGLLQKDPTQRLTWPGLLDATWVAGKVLVLPQSLDQTPLTCPLSSSQEFVKEQQKKKLLQIPKSVLQHSCKNKLYIESVKKKLLDDNAISSDLKEIVSNVDEPLEDSIKINAGEAKWVSSKHKNTINVKVEIHQEKSLNIEEEQNEEDNTMSAVGASVRKLSRISLEPGFKDEDVEDLKSCEPFPEERRKDSMSNYLANSVDSSRRGSQHSSRRGSYSHNGIVDILDNGQPSLPNINEESFVESSHDHNSVGVNSHKPFVNIFNLSSFSSQNKHIECEEWCMFLNKTLSEVLSGNAEIYTESELTMFVSPLRNPSCPLMVLTKIVLLLKLPFVNQLDIKLDKLYFECKIVPNLLYSCKLIVSKDSALNKEELDTLSKIIELMCHLIYTDKDFLFQLCDSVCVLDAYVTIAKLINLESHMDLVADTLAILNHILRKCPENDNIIEQILSKVNIISVISRLICKKPCKIRSRVCTFLAYLVCYCPLFSNGLKDEHKIISDLINLEGDEDADVRKAASFAVSNLQTFTNLMQDNEQEEEPIFL